MENSDSKFLVCRHTSDFKKKSMYEQFVFKNTENKQTNKKEQSVRKKLLSFQGFPAQHSF